MISDRHCGGRGFDSWREHAELFEQIGSQLRPRMPLSRPQVSASPLGPSRPIWSSAAARNSMLWSVRNFGGHSSRTGAAAAPALALIRADHMEDTLHWSRMPAAEVRNGCCWSFVLVSPPPDNSCHTVTLLMVEVAAGYHAVVKSAMSTTAESRHKHRQSDRTSCVLDGLVDAMFPAILSA